jgi:hypothetical protein
LAEQTEGVHLGQLITALQPNPQAAAETLAQILRAAADDDAVIGDHLQRWEPVITLTVAAAAGNAGATTQLTPILDHFAQDKDWAALAAVLSRIAGGEHGDGLLDGLDPIDTAVAAQVLTRLNPPPAAPGQEPQ